MGKEARNPLQAILVQMIKASARLGKTEHGFPCSCVLFREYMESCLYHPEYGYYRSGPVRVGREGDFYTAPYIGKIFAEVLADRLADLMVTSFGVQADPIDVLDWGGGTGRLGQQLLDRWNERGGQGGHYRLTVVEDHPAHFKEAERQLEAAIAEKRARLWSSSEAAAANWKDTPVLLIGNELLDAMPVHRVVRRDGKIQEWGVGWDEPNAQFVSCLMEPGRELLRAMERDGIQLDEGHTAEIGLDSGEWLLDVGQRIGEGLLVFVDYGDETEELVSAHRPEGTLIGYRRHHVVTNPYEWPGEQDLTAHVNFSSIRHYAKEAGWTELWYGTQKRFLVEGGILERLQPHAALDPFHPDARSNRAIRQLLLSDGMSELFKVQIFMKKRT